MILYERQMKKTILTLVFECSSVDQAEKLAVEVHGEFDGDNDPTKFPVLLLSKITEELPPVSTDQSSSFPMTPVTYCDHCGTACNPDTMYHVESLPCDISSENTGGSASLCHHCYNEKINKG